MQVREQTVEVPQFFKSSYSSLSTNLAAKENLKGIIHTKENIAEKICDKENVDSLHNRLQHEAEKIRKWKVQTEIDLKQKEQKIHEAIHTIDSLRKSTLELQLQNENLSLKLQEEIANREEITQKIDATRDMCDILKNYTVKVDDRLGKCETERTDLKFMEREYITQFEVLLANFKELSVTTSETHTKLNNQLETERESKQAIETYHHKYVKEMEEKLETLLQNCHDKDIELNLANAQLCEDQSSHKELQEKYVTLENRLSDDEKLIAEQKSELMLIQKQLTTLKLEKSDVEKRLDETSAKLCDVTDACENANREFKEKEQQLTDKLSSANEQLGVLQAQLDSANARITELQTNLTKAQNSVEDLKSSKDMMILERTDAKKNIEQLETEKKTLTQRIDEQGEQLRALSVMRMSLTQDYATLKESSKKLQEEMNIRQTEISESHEREKALNEKITALQSELENKSGEHLSAFEEIEKHNNESKVLQKELNNCKKEITKLKKDLEKSTTKDNQTKGKLEKALEESKSLRNKLVDVEKEFKTFKEQAAVFIEEEKKKAKHLNHESHDRETGDLKDKLNELEATVTAKNKQISQMEKEITKLNGDITENNNARKALNKQFVVQMNRMMASMDKAQQDAQQLMWKKDEELNELKEKIQNEVQQSEEAAVLKKELVDVNKKVEEFKNASLQHEKKVKDQEKTISELQVKLDAMTDTGIQRSILRQSNSVTKKRRVVFESDGMANTDSDSSAAEIDLDEMKKRIQNHSSSECRTPLLLRTSPYVRGFLSTPKKSPGLQTILGKTTNAHTPTANVQEITEKSPIIQEQACKSPNVQTSTEKSPNVRAARGKSSNVKEVAKDTNMHKELQSPGTTSSEQNTKKRGSQKKEDSELEKFKKLFPEKKPPQKNASNVRRAPTKSPGKFFNKPSPKNAKKKKSEMETSWFESDAVFGFGPED